MSEAVRLHERGRSKAVLIGAWDYTHLPPTPAVMHSLGRVYKLLTGSAVGWPQADIVRIDNPKNPGDLADRLMTTLDVEDVALFYYVGHGQDDENGDLCLGLTNSRHELHRRAATSLEYRDVRRALRHSSAAVRIVILDCCYSGIAVNPEQSLGSSENVAERLAQKASYRGAYVMTACSTYQEAWCETIAAGSSSKPQTYFSRFLADTVERGLPREPANLTLGLVFDSVKARLVEEGLPEPLMRTIDNPEGYVFARNMAPPETHLDPWEIVRQLQAELDMSYTRMESRSHPADASERELHDLREGHAEVADLRATITTAPTATEGSTGSAVSNARVLGAGILGELRRLRDCSGDPSASDISRLTRHTANPLRESDVNEIMTGQRAPLVDETLAVAQAVGSYANESGRQLAAIDYDSESWRTRYERLAPTSLKPNAANGMIAATQPGKRLISPTRNSNGPQTEEVREARRLGAEGKHRDAELILRRAARGGSVQASEAIAAMYQRQGRKEDFNRAVRHAEEIGSSRAAEYLGRVRRGKGRY